ncbi:MAG: sugar ABC transporter permease [Pseudomonadota bacterium]
MAWYSTPQKRKRAFALCGNALLFLGPALLLYGVFVIRPTLDVFRYSLFKWDGISPDMEWVGLGNYARLLGDSVFWTAFTNNIWWTVIIVLINVVGGLILAALMAQKIKGRTFFQVAFFLPVIQAPITTAVIWRWMYQPDGAVNAALAATGLEALARPWLGDFTWALPALAIAHAWSTVGLSVVIFLAGLQSVNPELYDAAKIDGATGVQSFRHVTLPALRPVTVVVFILVVTTAFKAFDLIWGTTQGGPIRASELLATYMYKRGVLESAYGFGSAVAVSLLLVVTVVMSAFLIWQQREDG